MEQLRFILLTRQRPNIQIMNIISQDTLEIVGFVDYDASPHFVLLQKPNEIWLSKPSKIPYLESIGMPTRILLKKRRFKCYPVL